MLRKAFWAAVVAVSLVAPLIAQNLGDYLDVYYVQVKPDKTAQFDALAKKIAEANRHNSGDTWLAMETVYGENNRIAFISTRASYADIDKAGDVFMAAMNKAFGKDTAEKMLNEWNSYLEESRSELRKRRWDLSWKAPMDRAGYVKFIGETRVLRTTAVHIRPGHVPDFEAMWKEVKAAEEKAENSQPVLVSQVIEGGKGATFYTSGLRPGLAGFDNNPTLKEILGEDAYKKYQQGIAENIESTQSTLYRYSAELSNPPQAVVAVAPDFWNPKTMTASKPAAKSKTEPVKPAAEKTKQ
jgi:hypothetical protein